MTWRGDFPVVFEDVQVTPYCRVSFNMKGATDPAVVVVKSTAGVLPIPHAMTQSSTSATKTPVPPSRLKVVVRRLPPDLTETEFWQALGDEWRAGNGKVDWFDFRPGKATKECVRNGV